MNQAQRKEWMQHFIGEVDWDTYDYTRAPGANMKFPDFTEAQMVEAEPWVAKHYNKTQDWDCVHVPDLNQIGDGEERRLYALFGVPVAWPSRKDEPEQVDALIAELDEAKEEGGETWAEAMGSHGLLNDEHYMWMRCRSLGFPKPLEDYGKAKAAIAAIDAAKQNVDGVLSQHGFRDMAHFAWFKKKVNKAGARAWAEQDALLQQTWKALDERFEVNKAALSDELAPFKGVSMEDWAGANARLVQAQPLESILKVLRIERPLWDEVNAEWNARMARDTTATIATLYGQAFTGAGQGKFAASAQGVSASMKQGFGNAPKADAPISFEDWIKIQAHISAGAAQGQDPSSILAKYKLNAADWGTAGGYWALQMSASPMEYLEQYQVLTAQYSAQFSGGGAGSDIEL